MMKRMSGAFCALALMSGALVALIATPAGAVTVSTEAELQTAFGTEAEIVLANDITLTCNGGGALARNSGTDLVLDGGGFTITQTCAGERVMQQQGSGVLDIRNVTLTGGNSTDPSTGGGAISDTGAISNVVVTNSTITGNDVNNLGGGAINADTIAVTDSTITDNHADDFGGAINGVHVTITRSTFAGNTSDNRAGAIGADDVTVVNSTITGNAANGEAGGFNGAGGGLDANSVELVYSTVVGNTAANGANVFAASALTAFASVVADPINSANCAVDSTSTSAYNFSDDASCSFTGTGDRQSAGSPGLDALGANGGPTLTMLPQAGSPLLDGVPVASCQDDGAAGVTTDQRGVTRPQGDGCDIGAVEVEVSSVPVTPVTPVTPIEAAPRFTG